MKRKIKKIINWLFMSEAEAIMKIYYKMLIIKILEQENSIKNQNYDGTD
jgi:hypothetical protein